ncbi:MAG: nickel/cobalt transporter [Myxococcota bacterium]
MLISLALAMAWGAAHALSPGHGKSLVGAYLIGARGRARDAFYLGGIVTITHTLGVFALGAITLLLSELIVPERVYPWLNLVAALLVVGVGLAVVRRRVGSWRAARGRARPHHHGCGHRRHEHGHRGQQGHDHRHGHHGHSHLPEAGTGIRGLVAVGVSGGLVPCPTALVVMLAAISLHRVAYGMVLIVAFSLGLAATVTAIGLVALYGRHLFERASGRGARLGLLPAASALGILALGALMTVRAISPLA